MKTKEIIEILSELKDSYIKHRDALKSFRYLSYKMKQDTKALMIETIIEECNGFIEDIDDTIKYIERNNDE